MTFEERLSPQPGFKETLIGKGIELVIFDFDDTLIATREIFLAQMNEFCAQVVSLSPELILSELKDMAEKSNNRSFVRYGVNPRKWTHVVEELVVECGEKHRSSISKAYPHLERIYTIPPVLKNGAQALLDQSSGEGVRLGLVTHANERWTHFKLDSSGLRKYFEKIIIISEDGHKTGEEWRKAISEFGVEPWEVLVIGDNIRGDIQAFYEAGVRHLVWFDEGDGWSIYRQGELPPETIVIHTLADLPGALIGNS